LWDVLPTALVCVAEAVVVFGIDGIYDSLCPAKTIWQLPVVLLLQFVFGSMIFIAVSYFARLKPLGEYLHILCPTLSRFAPTLATKLVKRFE